MAGKASFVPNKKTSSGFALEQNYQQLMKVPTLYVKKNINLSKRENMSTAMEKIEQSQLRRELPELRVGSSVRVNYRISEGNKERIQAFEGVIIGKHCGARNNKATFTVRKVTQGYGVAVSYTHLTLPTKA